jgi:DNA mismatch repair protein MutL
MAVAPSLPRIHQLPESVINQIAAGEVIERPASVVKELIENSFDAGATEISVAIVKGGKDLIRIRDNGHGIHPQDLPLALASHATSKLQDIGDLSRLRSLGFRGEALPSIASVSRFKLMSRAAGFEQGTAVSLDPVSGTQECLPAAHPVGTTVEVIQLFHTTPARRKFLRSEHTEYLHILEMIRCMALSRLDITLRLHHNGKQVFFARAAARAVSQRVEYVLGRAFTSVALALDYQVRDQRLWGWLGPPGQHRSQTDRQYFYLNGRLIRDRQVNHAVRVAYGDVVPAGRYPVYVLYLEMDAAAADVNVHPTKHEVRFRDAWDVHDFIYAGVRDALTTGTGVPGGVREPPESYPPCPATTLVPGAGTPAATCRLGEPMNCLLGSYILARRGAELVLIDARAVRTHLLKIRLAAVTVDNPLQSRPLLVPVEFGIDREHAPLVEAHGELLQAYGLTLALVSPVAVLVRSLPVVLADADLDSLLLAVLTGLARAERTQADPPACLDDVYADSVSAFSNAEPDVDEMRGLLRSLEYTGLDVTANHHPGLWRTLGPEIINSLIQNAG